MVREVSPLKKHIEESPKLRALRVKRQKARNRLSILLGILFLTVCGAFVYASYYPRLQLRTIRVVGNKVVDTAEIVAKVDTMLSGKYAHIIPMRNSFLYPKERIIATLDAAFPRFQSVTVYRADLNTLLVTVTEVRGHALWCGLDAVRVDTNVPCYFTDESGKIVSAAPQYSGNVYPRFFGGTIAGVSIETPAPDEILGKTFIEEPMFQNLLSFAERVHTLGFEVQAIVVGGGDENTLFLDLGDGKTAPIRFLKNDDLTVLFQNLSAALSKEELADALKDDTTKLEYFDLRFTNKVYYKFNDVQ